MDHILAAFFFVNSEYLVVFVVIVLIELPHRLEIQSKVHTEEQSAGFELLMEKQDWRL